MNGRGVATSEYVQYTFMGGPYSPNCIIMVLLDTHRVQLVCMFLLQRYAASCIADATSAGPCLTAYKLL